MDQAFENLPIKFDLEAIEKKRKPTPNCQICDALFTSGLGKNPIRHCKRCGASICDVCSQTRRVVSQTDKNVHRVCDRCDTEMDNFRLKENHKEVMKAQQERIEALNDEIVNLDNRKQELASNFEAEKEDLEKLLQSKYERRDELNQ